MVWYEGPPMTSGCKVGVLIPELLGTLCGCPWRCLWAAFWEFFPIPLCDVAGLVTEDHHSTQGFDLIVIFGSFCHTNWFWNQNFGTKLLQEKACCFCIVSIFLMYADITFWPQVEKLLLKVALLWCVGETQDPELEWFGAEVCFIHTKLMSRLDVSTMIS